MILIKCCLGRRWCVRIRTDNNSWLGGYVFNIINAGIIGYILDIQLWLNQVPNRFNIADSEGWKLKPTSSITSSDNLRLASSSLHCCFLAMASFAAVNVFCRCFLAGLHHRRWFWKGPGPKKERLQAEQVWASQYGSSSAVRFIKNACQWKVEGLPNLCPR